MLRRLLPRNKLPYPILGRSLLQNPLIPAMKKVKTRTKMKRMKRMMMQMTQMMKVFAGEGDVVHVLLQPLQSAKVEERRLLKPQLQISGRNVGDLLVLTLQWKLGSRPF